VSSESLRAIIEAEEGEGARPLVLPAVVPRQGRDIGGEEVEVATAVAVAAVDGLPRVVIPRAIPERAGARAGVEEVEGGEGGKDGWRGRE
jgi:hypothetical protein